MLTYRRNAGNWITSPRPCVTTKSHISGLTHQSSWSPTKAINKLLPPPGGPTKPVHMGNHPRTAMHTSAPPERRPPSSSYSLPQRTSYKSRLCWIQTCLLFFRKLLNHFGFITSYPLLTFFSFPFLVLLYSLPSATTIGSNPAFLWRINSYLLQLPMPKYCKKT